MTSLEINWEKVLSSLSASILQTEYLVILLFVLVCFTVYINIRFLIRSLKRRWEDKAIEDSKERFESKDAETAQRTGGIESAPKSDKQEVVNMKILSKESDRISVDVGFFLRLVGLILLDLVVSTAVGGAIWYTFYVPPWIVRTDPLADTYWDDYTKPIEVEFNVPIDTKKLTPNMSPEIEGDWEFIPIVKGLPYSRKIAFTPTHSMFSDEHVVIYMTGIAATEEKRRGYETAVEFDTPTVPDVYETLPADGGSKVPTDTEVVVRLSNAGKEYADWSFEIEPAIRFDVFDADDDSIGIRFKESLDQSTKYKVKILRRPIRVKIATDEVVDEGDTEEIYSFAFTTVKTPGIKKYSPSGAGALVDSVIQVTFDQAMSREAVEEAFSIDPVIEGDFSWKDDQTLYFVPQSDLKKATHYEIRFVKGIESKSEGKTQEDIVIGFDTVGAVAVKSVTPGNNVLGVSAGTNIVVEFNQAVDRQSAQRAFAISPSTPGTFTWDGSYKMVFNPSGSLGYEKNYSVAIKKGVKTLYGLDSTKDYRSGFKTIQEKVILAVPWYKQQHGFTCNVASTRMVLAYYGVYQSEYGVRAGIGEQPSRSAGGNPHVGWVSNYGVYWGPVASYISKYRPAEIKSGWNIQGIAREIQAGHPVILWWHNNWSDPYSITWTASNGSTIYGVNGMHSEVVKGFKGTVENPTYFYVNDPWRGNRVYSAEFLDSLWSRYFNRMAVVVK